MGDIYFLPFFLICIFQPFFKTLITHYSPSDKKIFTVCGGFLGWGVMFLK